MIGVTKAMRAVKLFVAAEYKHIQWEPYNKTESINISEDAVNVSAVNDSIFPFNDVDDFIFDRTDVRAIFITLYTLVFCCCFFGK